MKILSDLAALGKGRFGVTVGNFDGVHRGHAEMLGRVLERCRQEDLKFVVVTFCPHPRFVLQPTARRFLLSSYGYRRKFMKALGVDMLCEMNFTQQLSKLAPESFLNGHIFCGNGIKTMFLGHDFAFGANKAGDHQFVSDYCRKRDIDFAVLDEFKEDGLKISSSLIRRHLKEGEIESANRLLGRKFGLRGRIVRGDLRGSELGFPTANMQVEEDILLPSGGVYATVTKYQGKDYQSLTNIGRNPTFNGEHGLRVETHVLDFREDLYDRETEVFFVKKLRKEIRFSSVEELIAQIKEDIKERRLAAP